MRWKWLFAANAKPRRIRAGLAFAVGGGYRGGVKSQGEISRVVPDNQGPANQGRACEHQNNGFDLGRWAFRLNTPLCFDRASRQRKR